ncbi:MAG: hypothetical protein GX444_16235 [Myxococcales bacterium]|nr:hypothetical protein [Myxococcales bacterium]
MVIYSDEYGPNPELTGTSPIDGSFWILGYPVSSSPTSATVTLTDGITSPWRGMTVYANAVNILYTEPFGGPTNPGCSEE